MRVLGISNAARPRLREVREGLVHRWFHIGARMACSCLSDCSVVGPHRTYRAAMRVSQLGLHVVVHRALDGCFGFRLAPALGRKRFSLVQQRRPGLLAVG